MASIRTVFRKEKGENSTIFYRGVLSHSDRKGFFHGVSSRPARWVVRGFQQREGINIAEIFASLVKLMSYKAIFALAAAKHWEVHQMDVKTAFLYGLIEGEVYVQQPTGFDNRSGQVCKLRRALYGLKQSP